MGHCEQYVLCYAVFSLKKIATNLVYCSDDTCSYILFVYLLRIWAKSWRVVVEYQHRNLLKLSLLNTYQARKTDLIYFDVTSKENADFKNWKSLYAEN